MSVQGLITRSKTVNLLRNALNQKGFQEVVPQLLSEAVPAEPTIYPFEVKDNLYLATSPESYLKQAMAKGLGNCFAICQAFRNQEGKNDLHNPEFLMCEFYKKDAVCQEIIKILIEILNLKNPKQFSWLELWPELPTLINNQAMRQWAINKKYTINKDTTWEQLFYQYADNEIRKKFPSGPFFLTDFPTKISRLAKPKKGNPDFSERFELIIDGVEIADGNVEYFNEKAIRKILEAESIMRQAPVDEKFLAAIKTLEGQQWAGVGLGVDRLAMFYGKINSITELIW